MTKENKISLGDTLKKAQNETSLEKGSLKLNLAAVAAMHNAQERAMQNGQLFIAPPTRH